MQDAEVSRNEKGHTVLELPGRAGGLYYAKETDGGYRAFSGFSYIVCFKSQIIMSLPKQLDEFTTRIEAEAFCRKSAFKSSESMKADKFMRSYAGFLGLGLVPSEKNDGAHMTWLKMCDFVEVERTLNHVWYRKRGTI